MSCRNRGATLRLGGTVSDSILGSTRHLFLLTLKILKILGGGHVPPPAPGSACHDILMARRSTKENSEVWQGYTAMVQWVMQFLFSKGGQQVSLILLDNLASPSHYNK